VKVIGLGRSLGTLQDQGDLFVAEALVNPERERRLLLGGQRLDRLGDRSIPFVGHQESEGIRPRVRQLAVHPGRIFPGG
jgi:hypothetical protein